MMDIKLKPMLCRPSKPFDNPNWIFELKVDGTRAFIFIKNGKMKIQNRRLKDITYRYPELKEIPKFVKAKEVVLDGELVVLDEKGKPDFYKLATREQTTEKMKIEFFSKTIPATYFAFDIIFKDGKDLSKLPLIKRKKILKDTVKENPYIVVLDFVKEKGKEFFKAVVRKGLEGVVAKKINSIYEFGIRSNSWLKIKNLKTADCIIVGYTKGQGKREKTFGALILAMYDKKKLKYVGRVGTGWSDEEIENLKEKLAKIKTNKMPLKELPEDLKKKKVQWVKPKYVCEVKYMNVSPRLELRAPSFQRLRIDKAPKECLISDLE